jgi:hypothetical protein
MKRPVSDFKKLSQASLEQLQHFENDGIGVHWPVI